MLESVPSLLALQSIPVFAGLPEAELKKLAARARLRAFARKAIIVKHGEPSRDVFFLLAGFVKICRGGDLSRLRPVSDRRARPRQEVALAILGPGHIVGEAAVLTQANRSASVVALTNCDLIQFEPEDFIDAVRRSPDLAMAIMRHMATRIADANRQLDLLQSRVDARIRGLMRQFRDIGLPEDSFPSNAEIARMVGSTREVVSRALARQTEGKFG
jgi:CRP/FNR family transcriptional regulator, cyclic AMP receptor protein